MLNNTYDLHIHTSPDVIERKCSDFEVAQRMRKAGMRGGVIKSHHFETASRARCVCEHFPELNVFGGMCLNRSVGGLNPDAVERMAQLGGKFLWFPTVDSYWFQQYKNRNAKNVDLSHYISVLDENGVLSPSAVSCLDIAAKYSLTVPPMLFYLVILAKPPHLSLMKAWNYMHNC